MNKLIVPKASDIMHYHDKRIIKKKQFRFNNIPYIKQDNIKINNKLILHNLDHLIRKLVINVGMGLGLTLIY